MHIVLLYDVPIYIPYYSRNSCLYCNYNMHKKKNCYIDLRTCPNQLCSVFFLSRGLRFHHSLDEKSAAICTDSDVLQQRRKQIDPT